MTQHRFQRGKELILRGRNYVVEGRVENDKIQIRDIANNEYGILPELDLVEALFEGQMTFKTHRPQDGGSYADDLALVSEAKVIVAKRRLKYVQKCIDHKVDPGGAKRLQPIIELVAKELQDPAPPSCASLYRWMCSYRKSGADIRSLLPEHRRGNQKRKFGVKKGVRHTVAQAERTADVVRIVDDVVAQQYLSRKRHSVQAVYECIESRIHDENKYRTPDNRLPTPHISSLYKFVTGIDSYEKDRAREGKRFADLKHKQKGMGIRPERPLERVEIDHTKLDVIVVDDHSLIPLGRPWVTTAIDKGTGMPLGRYISFEPPCSNSVFQCLLHAIRPKTYLRDTFPNIQNDWEAYGLPESIASDNGMEFLGKHYQDACLQLGITVDYMPVRQPWFKATVERFYNTHNTRLIHRVPGTTFSNIFEKGEDYDPKDQAVIPFSTFVELYDTWIVDVYSRETRRGYEVSGPKNIPALSWREGTEKWPASLPPSNIDLDILLRMIEYRTIQHSGIELFGIRYNDPKLSLLRRELDGENVLVKYDSSNLGMIYVADVRRGTYIAVPAMSVGYAEGLSVYQNKIIRRYRREYLKGKEDIESLIKAKKRIREIVESGIKFSKGIKNNTRASRYLQIDSKTENLSKLDETTRNPQPNGNQPIPRLLGGAVPNADRGRNVLEPTFDVLEPRRIAETITGIAAVYANEASDANYVDFDDGQWTASHDLPVARNTYDTEQQP